MLSSLYASLNACALNAHRITATIVEYFVVSLPL